MAPVPLHVAVVDDEESIRKAMQRLLRAAGMHVETYSSGEEFLAREGADPDCLVIDLHMPGMDGFEVQERLQSAGRSLPVVVVTGHDKPEYRVRAAELRAARFLSKPVSADVLLSAIEAAASR